MVKLDIYDKKILYELYDNSRQPSSHIAKKIGLSKNAVPYRINKLEKSGVIKDYYTAIDSFKLGYDVIRFYINYQYLNPELEKEIISYFINCKDTWVVYSVDGWFDLDVIFWVKDINNLYQFWVKTIEKYGDYFLNYTVSFLIQNIMFKPTFLFPETIDRQEREDILETGGGPKVKIDDFDFKLLKVIAPNARISLLEIATQLHSSVSTVKNRLTRLIDTQVIQSFSINVDIKKFGYDYFGVEIFLKESSQRNKIVEYLKYNPYLMGIVRNIGICDLQLEFFLRDINHLTKIVNNLTDKFPDTIRNYRYVVVKKIHKWLWIPETLE